MLQMQKTMFPAGNSTATRAKANSAGMYARAISLLICVLSIVSCEFEIPMVNLGIDDSYTIERMRTLVLHPEYEGDAYEWYLLSSPRTTTSSQLIASTRDLIFCQAETGTYHLQLNILDDKNPISHNLTIVVWEEEVAYSPYISHVIEYCPAPGQFVNVMPEYEEGDDYQTMLKKAEQAIVGNNRGLISLGAWGGYVTFGFDHSVVNIHGESDFLIEGNAFAANTNTKRGSSEPGIVMVSVDVNQNGLPDDPFYELAGSEYTNPNTIPNYAITYHRTPADHTPAPNKKESLTDTAYIYWLNNRGDSGYLAKNTFHTQDYFPQWISDSTLTFTGTRLPNNATKFSGNNYVLDFFGAGYADCHPNDSTHLCSFDIAWAVDSEGCAVDLPCVDFIRVYTGIHQQCGWIGETSTEISHARDLHL